MIKSKYQIFQAFLIAFTSDFIQKIVYKYEYGEDGTMDNYVMFTLSKSPEKNWIERGQVQLYKKIKNLEFLIQVLSPHSFLSMII